jgi:hypothetical protein
MLYSALFQDYLSAVKQLRLSLLLPIGVLVATGFMQRAAPPPASGVTPKVIGAAKAFLATLDDGQRAKVTFDFNSPQKTTGWSNLPTGIFERHGLRLGDLTSTQREAALATVSAALSRSGVSKSHRNHEW